MQRTLFRCGNSVVVSLPRDALGKLGWSAGTRVTVTLDEERHRIVISSDAPPVSGEDETFARKGTNSSPGMARHYGLSRISGSLSGDYSQVGQAGDSTLVPYRRSWSGAWPGSRLSCLVEM